MEKLIKDMTYKEFNDYCNERACDGQWSMDEATAYINIMKEVDSIEIKFLGITRRILTRKMREEKWNELKNRIFEY